MNQLPDLVLEIIISYCELDDLISFEAIEPNLVRTYLLKHYWSTGSLAKIFKDNSRLKDLKQHNHNYDALLEFCNNNDDHSGNSIRTCSYCNYMFLDIPENVYDCDYCCKIICCLKCNPEKMKQVAHRCTNNIHGNHLCSTCSN